MRKDTVGTPNEGSSSFWSGILWVVACGLIKLNVVLSTTVLFCVDFVKDFCFLAGMAFGQMFYFLFI